MTKEQAIELAKQAGAETSDGVHWEFDDFDPIKFYTLVRNAALEEAALECRTQHGYFKDNLTNIECALAIESLKEPKP